jgi:hypothetical protein
MPLHCKYYAIQGVRIQIDDFGTGYSSLSYLRELPIDTLKIDRSFVNHVDENPADQAIVSAILAMAKSLSLRVVAEGIETAAQLEVLNRHGCEVAQGFFFSRPLPAEQCRALLEELATRPSFTETVRMRLRKGLPAIVAPIRINVKTDCAPPALARRHSVTRTATESSAQVRTRSTRSWGIDRAASHRVVLYKQACDRVRAIKEGCYHDHVHGRTHGLIMAMPATGSHDPGRGIWQASVGRTGST